MAPKRKSDVLLESLDDAVAVHTAAVEGVEGAPPAKQPRVGDAADAPSASSSKAKKSKAKGKAKDTDADDEGKTKHWSEVKLDGEDEDGVPVYDDCNDIRRKIRTLMQEPGFKITAWLREIGNINNNSYQRFMKASGPTGGAENGTYYAAYVYFEKRRILEGKKKSAKRIRSEDEFPNGRPLRDIKHVWVVGPRR